MSHNEPAARTNAGELVFLVDDEPVFREVATAFLAAEGYLVESFSTAEACLARMQQVLPTALLLDLQLDGMSGSAALSHIYQLDRDMPVVVVSASESPRLIASITQSGAYDFMVKPVERKRLTTTVRNAVERRKLARRVVELELADQAPSTAAIIGSCPKMQRLRASIRRVAASDVNVMIQGESGVGKELVARAIHDGSARSNGRFVAINCAAIPENLEEAELFGHEKGAFTGASAGRAGTIEQAHGGTLLLDEIADLSLASQSKLLRVLQERKLQRVGSSTLIDVDFRLVAASHKSLRDEVSHGRFREDLFFRIVVFEVEVPPLRDRPGDVRLLVSHFVSELGPKLIGRVPIVSPETLVVLEHYPWPGNVRELHNALQRGIVNCTGGMLLPSDLPSSIAARMPKSLRSMAPTDEPPPSSDAFTFEQVVAGMSLQQLEKRAIELSIVRHGQVMSRVARELGIARSTLYRKVREHGIVM